MADGRSTRTLATAEPIARAALVAAVAFGDRLRSSEAVHPLILLTLASLLVVLFGVTGLVISRGQPPSEAQRRAGSGVPGLKRLIAAGAWRAALPALLVTGGMLGLMIFGSLVLIVVLEQRASGVLMLGVALFALVRILIEYRRA